LVPLAVAVLRAAGHGPTETSQRATGRCDPVLAFVAVGGTHLLTRKNPASQAPQAGEPSANSGKTVTSSSEAPGLTSAEAAANATGLTFDSILDSLSSAVIAVQQDGKIIFANKATSRLLNTPREDLVGCRISVLPNSLNGLMSRCMATGCEVSDHQVPPHGEGLTPLTVSISLVHNSSGDPPGGVMILNDASDLEELRRRVRDQERLAWLGTLAAAVAHELKNPLVSVRTLAQLLPEKFDDAEFRNEFSTLALSEVDRINEMVERLLDFARPSQPSVEAVDVNRLLEDTIALLKPQTAENNVKVEALFTAPEATLMGDATQLKQVFLNLALNSIQALGHQGALTVRTSNPADSSELVVEIVDDGIGIPEDKIDKVFDPFFSTKPHGTGLGLTISQMIVLQHSGTMEVKSQEGKGTTFIVRLPLTSHNPDRIAQ